ncbi:MAG TPA: LuxR C-terminal-related transcriptional regulator [Thermomicrobiales bacterium]|nr:LuxR C-terminal-related transcriptional regulator [Thermomicrobiales bacterium]
MPAANEQESPAREILPRDPQLITKLLPPPSPRDLIARPHLAKAIEPKPGQQITLISAPTGFGKTTAMQEWASTTERAVCWVSLDSGDNEPDGFWSYVVSAIERGQPGFSATARSLLHTPEAVSAEYVVTAIINELAQIPDPVSLILDDYHLISNEIIHRSMRFLIDHLPAHVHLLVAGLSDPPLGLPRLRAQGRLIELRGPDLCFQPDDTAALLIETLGLSLSAADVQNLQQRTEGWVAGLRLAALALRQQSDPAAFIDGFNGNHRSVGDYLADDVLGRQPEEIQRFMIETSILNQMSGPLCDAVSDRHDSQAILETLEHANAFLVPLDDRRQWFRYQGLFADVLRERFARAGDEVIRTIHRRAAIWYYEQRMTRDAMRHALASGDLDLVAEIVEQRACPMLASGELETIKRWIEPLPREMIERRPILGCLRAWVLVLTGRVDEAEPLLDAVEAQMSDDERQAIGEIAAIRAYAARLRHEIPRAIELSRQARALTPASSFSVRRAIALNYGIALWWRWEAAEAERAFREAADLAEAGGELGAAVVARCHLARIRSDQGYLDQAWELFQEAAGLAEHWNVSSLPSQSFVHLGMAYVLIERDDLDAAETCLTECIRLGTAGGKIDHVMLAHVELTRVALARGDLDAAHNAIRAAQTTIDQHPVVHLAAEIALVQVMLWLAEGDLAAASTWATETLARAGGQAETLSEPERLALVHLRLAQDEAADAEAILASLHERSAATFPKGWNTCRIVTLILLARVHDAAGRHDAARDTLDEALRIAQPLGHIRTFAEHGAALVPLLVRIQPNAAISRAYLDRLLDACTPATTAMPSATTLGPVTTALTRRELQVLRHIQDGLSNREIAEALFVTVGTVKRHTNSIYSKLAVNSRTQALAKARLLRLIGQ